MNSDQHLFFFLVIILLCFSSTNELKAQNNQSSGFEYSGEEIDFGSSKEEGQNNNEEKVSKKEDIKEVEFINEPSEVKPTDANSRDSEYVNSFSVPKDVKVTTNVYVGAAKRTYPDSKHNSNNKGKKIYEDDGIQQIEYKNQEKVVESETINVQEEKSAVVQEDLSNKKKANPSPYQPATYDSPSYDSPYDIKYGVAESEPVNNKQNTVNNQVNTTNDRSSIPIATSTPVTTVPKKNVGVLRPDVLPPNTTITPPRTISSGTVPPGAINTGHISFEAPVVSSPNPSTRTISPAPVTTNTVRSVSPTPSPISSGGGTLYNVRKPENVIGSSKIISDDHGVYPNDPSLIPSFSDEEYARKIANLPTIIPMEYNKHVKRFINMFTLEKRDQVEVMLAKADVYFPVFEDALLRHGLPIELKYMPIIESALMPHSESEDGGVGLWQLNYGTAKLYGLEANSYVDERRDPKLSTEVAVKHLETLYKKYKDWYLVIAAYSCGEGTLNKAIKRSGGNKNYWELLQFLPKETRAYVPLFISSTYLMHHYKDHNLYKKEAPYSFYVTDTVRVKNNIDLKEAAQFINISIDELLFLNPALLKNVIPASRKGYPLVLPISKIPIFETYLLNNRSNSDIIYSEDVNAVELNPNSPWNLVDGDYRKKGKKEKDVFYVTQLKHINHVVGPNESLEDIAVFYDSKVEELMNLNQLFSREVKVGQTLKVLVPGDLEKLYLNIQARRDGALTDQEKADLERVKLELENKKNSRPSSYVWHSIKKDDTFKSISRKFKVSVESITRLNGFQGLQSELVPGRSIRIPRTN